MINLLTWLPEYWKRYVSSYRSHSFSLAKLCAFDCPPPPPPNNKEISYLILLQSAQNGLLCHLLQVITCYWKSSPAHKVSFGILRSTKCIQNQWQHYVRIAYSGERMVYQSFGSHGTRKSTCNGQTFTEPCHVVYYGIEHYVQSL